MNHQQDEQVSTPGTKVDEYFQIKQTLKTLRDDLKEHKENHDNFDEIDDLGKKLKILREQI